ncbi:arginyl-tRNA synthetase [Formivibrio citricus]|uniref:Arginine--tRNA ligase n=2 Tax=Formivibrio citricus TaxID=83765 RepID=A0A1I5C2N5_9NEIS|nr:arginyl-tRNA synthetase [Formivibrio citricus]
MPQLDFRQYLSDLLADALKAVAPDSTDTAFVVERPKDARHGDYATNLAMQLARPLRQPPRALAEKIIKELPLSEWVEKAEIAGAGFINFTLTHAARQRIVRDALQAGANFGRTRYGKGQKIQVEFVSANPTGPLHVGHGRGAAYGASLSTLLDFAGFNVQREYYVNDAGRQMDILAVSTWLRYLDLHKVSIPFPPNGYQGDYVRDMAIQIQALHGDAYVRAAADVVKNAPNVEEDKEAHLDALIANAKALLGDAWHYIHNHALTEQLNDGRDDLTEFGVTFDCWFSEKSLFETGLVARVVEKLETAGHIYVQDGAKWFRSTTFGDEKDRVVQRDNGLYTYFASDIAYHLNKFERGFDKVINIWGADHHGYIARVKGALAALGLDPAKLDIALVQFANLIRDGQQVAMSTRSGSFVTLRDLRSDVGNDAARLFYVLRKSDQHLDFDLDLAKSQSNDNPVYYIQYAHARICRVLEEWGGCKKDLPGAQIGLLTSEHEAALLRKLADFPAAIDAAAVDYAPHTIAFYLKDLAADFHSYYNVSRFLTDDEELTYARLALVSSVQQVLANGLAILGVSAPEKM